MIVTAALASCPTNLPGASALQRGLSVPGRRRVTSRQSTEGNHLRVQAWRREKLGSSVAWADSPWLVMNDRLQRCPVEADRMLGEELDAGRKHRSMLRVVDEDVA